MLRYVKKTSKACYETVTDTVEQHAKVKIPLSLPEVCIGNRKSMAQNHIGFPRALHGSNSTEKCVYVCVFVMCVVVGPTCLWVFLFFFKFHLVSINCNQVSCGFHSKKSKVKINDLQQVAMAVNKHLMNALSCLGF